MVDIRGKLTVKEVAERLEVDPKTIRFWADQKKIPCYRHPINNYRLFDWDEVRKAVDLRKEDSIASE